MDERMNHRERRARRESHRETSCDKSVAHFLSSTFHFSLCHLCALCVLCGYLLLPGCGSTPNRRAELAYYDHAYPAARQAVRQPAADRQSNDVVLNNMRLGLASLADGDLDESQRALLRAYEYLRSGGVNTEDRTVASEWIGEDIKVWKGEPYEQAMSYYYISALFMLRGDWENARAAAQNSLFALRDFGDHQDSPKQMGDLVERAVISEKRGGKDYFDEGYTAIESQFTLGYLMAATSYVLMNQPDDATRMFDHVRQLRPELSTLVDTLAANEYDTLLLIDVGRGPTKQAYGPDNALIRYVPNGRRNPVPVVSVSVNGENTQLPTGQPVVDLWTLSQYPKWWSLESMRQAKSTIGNVLLVGGLGAASVGRGRSDEAVYAGLGAAALGMLLKASSQADTRHLEMLPRCTYIVPLKLGDGLRDVSVRFNQGQSNATWHDLVGGEAGDPRVYYLRHHDGRGRGMPPWKDQSPPLYSLSAQRYQPGDRPYIMGGRDVTPPSPEILKAYHDAGVLTNMTLERLRTFYDAEGIIYRSGPQGRDAEAGGLHPDLYRHITAGGRVMDQPRPGTHRYERITRIEHAPYTPRSAALRNRNAVVE